MSSKAAIRAILMQDNALNYVSSALRPAPVNDEVGDELGTILKEPYAFFMLPAGCMGGLAGLSVAQVMSKTAAYHHKLVLQP